MARIFLSFFLSSSLALVVGCGDESDATSTFVGGGVVGVQGGRLSTASSLSTESSEASGSAGTDGSAETDVAVFEAEIPADAVEADTELSVAEAPAGDEAVRNAPEKLGPAYKMGPEGTAFAKKIKLHIKCQKNTRPLIASTKLTLSQLKDGTWEALEGATWNPENCDAEGLTQQTGTFALVPDAAVPSIDDAQGTDFTVGNLRVQTSVQVQASIAVSGDGIRMELKATGNSKKATVTLSGLRPKGDVYVFDGSYDKKTVGKSGADGSFSYEQSLSKETRLVWVQPVPATIYLKADGTGCSSAGGTWNGKGLRCTLNKGVDTGIQIDGADVSLDCGGWTLLGNRTGAGVIANARGVRVQNCEISGFDIGVIIKAGFASVSVSRNRFDVTTDALQVYGTNANVYDNVMSGTMIGGHTLARPAYGLRTAQPLKFYLNDVNATTKNVYYTVSTPAIALDNGSTTARKGNYWAHNCSTTPTGPWFVAATDANNSAVSDGAPFGVPLHYWDGTKVVAVSSTIPTGCAADADRDGYAATAYGGNDCDDSRSFINPGRSEVCDLADFDEDCDTKADDQDTGGATGKSTWYIDADNDGYTPANHLVRCDRPSSSYKLRSELLAFGSGNEDCRDDRAETHPGAAEVPGDGIDQNCDAVDLCYIDNDGDGFGSTQTSNGISMVCAEAGDRSGNNTDCNDANWEINPTTLWYIDCDGDGYTSGDYILQCLPPSCGRLRREVMPPPGSGGLHRDCFDNPGDAQAQASYPGVQAASVHPGAREACDNVDSDCDGSLVDDYLDNDSNGVPDCSDRDGDGVADADDNCPDDVNPNQADQDNDDLGDVCDYCNAAGAATKDVAATCTSFALNCGVIYSLPGCPNPTPYSCGDCTGGLACGGGGLSNVCGSGAIVEEPALPPVLDLPDLPADRGTTIGDIAGFLYVGGNAPQKKNPGAPAELSTVIEPKRMSVLRGKVLSESVPGNATALPGAKVEILNHPEFGYTTTFTDGQFFMVVNGGGSLVVQFTSTGYITAQRTVVASSEQFAIVDDVVLVPREAAAAGGSFAFGVNSAFHVVTGQQKSDTSQTRRPYVFFLAGTQATAIRNNGAQVALGSVNMGITEFTVGTNGPARMPGNLPPTNAYTYAAEIDFVESPPDTARVELSQAAIAYLKTSGFVNVPPGTIVPVGSYNRQTGLWEPMPDGVVVRIAEIVNESGTLRARLSVAETGLGSTSAELTARGLPPGEVTDLERQKLAELFVVGDRLWRTRLTHFSPYDLNQIPPVLIQEAQDTIDDADVPQEPDLLCEDSKPGSIIECESQSIGEHVGLVGTPLELYYRSKAVRDNSRSARVQLLGAEYSGDLAHVRATLQIAGREISVQLSPRQHLSTILTWDGLDAFGRPVVGAQHGRISIAYSFNGTTYRVPRSSGESFGADVVTDPTSVSMRQPFVLTRDFPVVLAGFDVKEPGLGGWNVGVNHRLDRATGRVLLGTGETVTVGQNFQPVAGGGTSLDFLTGIPVAAELADIEDLHGLWSGPDGSLYFNVDSHGCAGARLKDGFVTGVESEYGFDCPGVDDLPDCDLPQHDTYIVGVGPDGSVYLNETTADCCNYSQCPQLSKVWRLWPQGVRPTGATCTTGVCLSHVVGGAANYPTGDDGPATAAGISGRELVVVASENGIIYFTDNYDTELYSPRSIRQIDLDGIVRVYSRSLKTASKPYPGPAGVALNSLWVAYLGEAGNGPGLNMLPGGRLLMLDYATQDDANVVVVTAIGVDHLARALIGDDVDSPACAAGLSPLSCRLKADSTVLDLDIDTTGEPLITVGYNNGSGVYDEDISVLTIKDGTLRAVASGILGRQILSVAMTPDGTLWSASASTTDSDDVRIGPMAVGLQVSGGIVTVPSPDGSQLWVFDSAGRHLRTRDALTGALVYEFGYDTNNRLGSVSDANGSLVTIGHAGNQATITARTGQITTLTKDANGWLSSIMTPGNIEYRPVHNSQGYLTQLTDPRNNHYSFEYDAEFPGRLRKYSDPYSGSYTFVRTSTSADGTTVSMTSNDGRTSQYTVLGEAGGVTRSSKRGPDGQLVTTIAGPAGSTVVVGEDPSQPATVVSTTTTKLASDPRFGLAVPYVAATTTEIVAPYATLRASEKRGPVVLLDPANPESGVQSMQRFTCINGAGDAEVCAGGQRFTLSYAQTTDGNGVTTRQATLTTPKNGTLVTKLDDKGRTVSSQLESLAATVYSYYSNASEAYRFGKLWKVTQGDREVTFNYVNDSTDVSHGMLDSVAGPISGPPVQQTSFGYDEAGRVNSILRADSQTVTTSYDANGNMVSLTPPGKNAHNQDYTEVNLLQSYSAPGTAAGHSDVAYQYTGDRLPQSFTKADGRGVVIRYEPTSERVDALYQQDNTTLVTDFQYYTAADGVPAKVGLLKTAQHVAGLLVTYDYLGTMLSSQQWTGTVAGSVSYGYDGQLRLFSQTAGGSAIYHYYDEMQALKSVGVAEGESGVALTLKRDYDAIPLVSRTGQIEFATLSDGTKAVVTSFDYEPSFGELYQLWSTHGNVGAASPTNLFAVTYSTRDKLGRVTQATVRYLVGTVRETQYDYAYDAAGRLLSVSVTENGVTTSVRYYCYDANGNRRGVSSTGATGCSAFNQLVNDSDQLSSYAGKAFTYTANGEVATKGTTSYAYDVFGNMLTAGASPSTGVTYTYDHMNRRVTRTYNSITQKWVYDSYLRPVLELNGANAVQSRFVYGTRINVPEYIVKLGFTYRVLTDHLGSVRMVVKLSDGTIAQQIDYDEFGNVLSDTSPGFQPFGFAGGFYDSVTKLVHFGARDYDPETGRWMQRDPILFGGGDTNLYVYAANDPLNYRDVNGLTIHGDGTPQGDADVEGLVTRLSGIPALHDLMAQLMSDDGPQIWVRVQSPVPMDKLCFTGGAFSFSGIGNNWVIELDTAFVASMFPDGPPTEAQVLAHELGEVYEQSRPQLFPYGFTSKSRSHETGLEWEKAAGWDRPFMRGSCQCQ